MPGSVLVVDDDPGFRALARRLLVASGLVVAGEAESFATAMAAAHELRPDGALVDIRLPDGDGVDLARELRALPWRPRVVLTSADPDAAAPDDVTSCGAGAFFAKDHLPNVSLSRLLATP